MPEPRLAPEDQAALGLTQRPGTVFGLTGAPQEGGPLSAQRLGHVEDASLATLPTQVSLAMSQAGLSDDELRRAAISLAQQFDITPETIFAPVGIDPSVFGYKDPLTGHVLSLETARRLLQIHEPDVLAQMFKQVLAPPKPEIVGDMGPTFRGPLPGPAVDPKKLAAFIQAMAPLEGDDFSMTDALGAAAVMTQNKIDPQVFGRNLLVTSSIDYLSEPEQVALAQAGAAAGTTFGNRTDAVIAYFRATGAASTAEEVAGAQRVRQQGPTAERVYQAFNENPNPFGEGPDAQEKARAYAKEHGLDPEKVISGETPVHLALAGIGLLNQIEQNTGDYVAYGQKLAHDLAIEDAAFKHSFAGKYIAGPLAFVVGKAANGLEAGVHGVAIGSFRLYEQAAGIRYLPNGEQIADPNDPRYSYARPALEQEWHDIQDTWNGGKTVADTLVESYHADRATAAMMDLVLGVTVGPDMIALRLVAAGREAKLLHSIQDVVDYIQTPARRLGGRTVGEYFADTLIDGINKGRNVDSIWARTVDRFRRYYSTVGWDYQTATAVYDETKTMVEGGFSRKEIVDQINSVLYTSFGVRPPEGSMANRIYRLRRILETQSTQLPQDLFDVERYPLISEEARRRSAAHLLGHMEDFHDAWGAQLIPGTRLGGEALRPDIARVMFSPDYLTKSGTLEFGELLQQEIPHLAFPIRPFGLRSLGLAEDRLGRVTRALFKGSPGGAGIGRLALNISDRDAAVRGIEEVAIRAHLPEETVAAYRFRAARALASEFPEHQMSFVVRDLEKTVSESIMRDTGITQEQFDHMLAAAKKHWGWHEPKQAFGVVETAGEPTIIRNQPILQTQLVNDLPITDPVFMRRSVAESIGTVKRWKQVLLADLGHQHIPQELLDLQSRLERLVQEGKPITKSLAKQLVAGTALTDVGTSQEALAAVKAEILTHTPSNVSLPLRLAFDRTSDLLINDLFLSFWKPLVVLRPAYVLRVVGLEEQIRFFSTTSLLRRMESGRWGSKVLGGLDSILGREVTEIPLVDELGRTLVEYKAGVKAQSTVEHGLVALSSVDEDRAAIRNFRGFNKQDSEIGNALAAKVRRGEVLTADEATAAKDLLSRYKVQLRGFGIDSDAIKARSTEKAVAKAQEYGDSFTRAAKTVTLGGRPGITVDDELASLAQNVKKGMATSGVKGGQGYYARKFFEDANLSDWGDVPRSAKHFYDVWFHDLQRQFGRDELGVRNLRAILRGDSPEKMLADSMQWLQDAAGAGPGYARRLMGRSAFTPEDLEDVVKKHIAVLSSYTGRNPDLAAAVLSNTLTVDYLKAMPEDFGPQIIHGPQLESVLGKEGPIKSAVGFMADAFLRTPTNKLSRVPYFKAWYDRTLEQLVQQSADQGFALTEAAFGRMQNVARSFALDQVNRIMFDFTRQARLGDLLYWAIPFFQPFSEAFVVWGRILRQNPAVAGWAYHLYRAGKQSGFLREDPDTHETVIPLSNWLAAVPFGIAMGWLPTEKAADQSVLARIFSGNAFANTGWGISAPLTSFNFFFQASLPTSDIVGFDIPLPGLSPQVNWFVQRALESKYNPLPDAVTARLSSWAFQYGEINWSDPKSFIPAYLRHTLEGIMGEKWFASEIRSQANHQLKIMQQLGYGPVSSEEAVRTGTLYPKPIPGFSAEAWSALTDDQKKRKLGDMARNNARGVSYWRAIYSAFGFAAPRVEWPTDELQNEYADLVKAKGGAAAANDEWAKLHPNLSLIPIGLSIWNPTNPSPVPIPSSQAINRLLNSDGGKRFAAQHPRFLFAIIPHELQDAAFDAGSFFQQIGQGTRIIRPLESSPTVASLLDEDERRKGWDAWFLLNDSWTAQQEAMTTRGLKETDQTWKLAADDYNRNVAMLKQTFPSWRADFEQHTDSGVLPGVEREARDLAANPEFLKTDTGKWLRDYFIMRDRVAREMSALNIKNIRTASAERAGLTAEYDTAVENLNKQYGDDGLTTYRAFFSHDLEGVMGKGQQIRDALTPAQASAVAGWETDQRALSAAILAARTTTERNAAYSAAREHVNAAYAQFGDSPQNPAILHWLDLAPSDRLDTEYGLVFRPYEFLSRADRQQILGEQTSDSAEASWDQIDELRVSIARALDANPTLDAGKLYDQVDVLVAQKQAQDPLFAQQVEHANTWGYLPEKIVGMVYGPTNQAKPWWDAFFGALRQVQQIADAYDLHGTKDPNPDHRQLYGALYRQMLGYVDALSTDDPLFATQWNTLENISSDPLMTAMMPDNYYRLGVVGR